MIINQVGLGGGEEPTGTINITNNGSYSVTPYATAEVNISGGGTPIVLDELNVTPSTSSQTLTPPTGINGYNVISVDAVDSTIDSNIQPGNIKSGVSILGVTGSYSGDSTCIEYDVYSGQVRKARINVGTLTTASTAYMFCREFYKSYNNVSYVVGGVAIKTPNNLESINGTSVFSSTFYNHPEITSTGLNKLKSISGSECCYHTFESCTGLTSTGLSSLETITGSGQTPCMSMFQGCTSLTDICLPNLTTATPLCACQAMFMRCTSLTAAEFPKLSNIAGNYILTQLFSGCNKLKTVSFPSLNSSSFGAYANQFGNMLQNITGCTVHFPSNLQSVIGSWSDIVNGFGGSNTTVLFDLPATF